MVAVGLFHGSQFLGIADAARNDAVHQSGAEGVCVVHPVDECRLQIPILGVVVAALLQLLAVVVDQFAGQDGQTLVSSAVECLVALEQHAGQLCGEAVGRNLIELAVTLRVGDAGFSGVWKRWSRDRQNVPVPALRPTCRRCRGTHSRTRRRSRALHRPSGPSRCRAGTGCTGPPAR